MKIKFLIETKNLENPKYNYQKGEVYELENERAKKAIRLGFATEVLDGEKLLETPVCGLNLELKNYNDPKYLEELISKDGRVTAKRAYQERIDEILEKK